MIPRLLWVTRTCHKFVWYIRWWYRNKGDDYQEPLLVFTPDGFGAWVPGLLEIFWGGATAEIPRAFEVFVFADIFGSEGWFFDGIEVCLDFDSMGVALVLVANGNTAGLALGVCWLSTEVFFSNLVCYALYLRSSSGVGIGIPVTSTIFLSLALI